MNLPPLPELPEPFDLLDGEAVFDFIGGNFNRVEFENPSPEGQLRPTVFSSNDTYSMSAHDIASAVSWADMFTADQLRAYALAYGRAVQEACARLCDQVAYDWDEQRPFRRVAEDCATAIRNGVIREGEGE